MRKVLTGKNAVLSVKIDTTWYAVLCATDSTFYFDHEEIRTSSRNTGKARERQTRLMDWGFSLTGHSKIDDTDGQKSFFWLAQASVRGTTQLMRVRYTDGDGNQMDISGNVLIKQGQFSSVIPAFSTATLNFPGSGEPDLGATSGGTPVNEYVLYLNTTEGAFEVSHADLGGAAMISLVGREDGFYTETTGTPSGRQFKFTDLVTSGKLTFDSTLPFNAGEIVYVRFYK